MKGFFYTKKELDVKAKQKTCETCRLYQQCKSPKMEPVGKGKRGILIIAEAPSKNEDESGAQLFGPAGQVLREALNGAGIDLDRDCKKTNAICCHPPNSRTPSPAEIESCRPRLWKEIKEYKPKLIIVLGATAAKAFLQHRWKKDFPEISALRGWIVPDRDTQCWVTYTFHPSYLLYNQKNETINMTFKRDIANAIKQCNKNLPKLTSEKKLVEVLHNEKIILKEMFKIMDKPPEELAIDYETSGLKPYKKGHYIRTCAIAYWDKTKNRPKVFAFKVTKALRPQLQAYILNNPEVPKVAQHVPHENSWTNLIFRTGVQNWHWDTALASHFQDSRSGTAGLKFQAYVRYGLADYSHEIESYLTSGEKDGNAFNRIDKAPIDKLLLYNGIDVVITLRQVRRQKREIGELSKGNGYALLHEGMLELCGVEMHGMRIHRKRCKRQIEKIESRQWKLRHKILNDKVIKKWKKREGDKFKLNSPVQLQKTLFGKVEDGGLGLKPIKMTKNAKKETPSVDKEVLEFYSNKVAFLKYLRKIKQLETPKNFLLNWLREAVDGVLHPQFSLTSAETFRSSCSHPNLQNVPRRDMRMQKILRKSIFPSKGRQLLEADFKGIEVVTSASYHKDPNMIRYLKDKSNNMHTDTSAELFLLPKEDIMKPMRDIGKNAFVFPEFYNSYYADIAPNIWKDIGKYNVMLKDGKTTLKEHLYKKGIKSLSQFTDHVQKVENHFWSVRFPTYAKWKRNMEQGYPTKGYLELLTGFRCSGPLRRNQIINFPIQGTAFHCLLWTLIQLCKYIRKHNLKSHVCSQIHDSIVIDLVPKEKEEIIKALKHIVEVRLRKHWKWIIVPMEIEMEIAGIDRPWYEKKAIK